MALMAAEIIRLIANRLLQCSGRGVSFMIMLRLWLITLLCVLVSFPLLRSIAPPFLAFFRQALVPHLRGSMLTVLNTQPLLFLLLNSMIFAVLAPSGLFKDRCNCSSTTSSSDFPSNSTDSLEESGVDPNSKQILTNLQDPASSVSKPQESVEDQATHALRSDRRSRAESSSPPKVRVKRKKTQKSQSVTHLRQQITIGIVENDQQARNHVDSARDQPDSLKDEDFKQFIDSYIARAHEQILSQEREYAASTARSRS